MARVAVSTSPENNLIRTQLQQVTKMLRTGATAAALDFLLRLEQDNPDQADILRMRGIVLSRMGQDEQAESVLRRLSDLLPASRDAASDHANVLLNLGRADEALGVLLSHAPEDGLDSLGPDAGTFAFNLGRAYKASGQAAQARVWLQQALAWQPDHYGALLTLGDVYKALGKIALSESTFRKAIALQPADGTAWWSFSNLKSGGFTDAEFELLQKHAVAATRAEQKVFFEFAVATGFEQRDQPDEAFTHYASGNRLKCQLEPWDGSGFTVWLEDMKLAMKDLILPARPTSLGRPRPVFLVSLPRSGSTLTEQILAAHSSVTAASELPWLPHLMAQESRGRQAGISSWSSVFSAADWRALGDAYLEYCKPWYEKTPVFTDKLPGNFPYVGAILAMLPDALVINVRRNAMDVCWSCYRQLFISGSGFAYDLKDLAAYWKDHRQTMDYWQSRAPDRVLNVDYEALVKEPEKETRALLSFLELPFEAACLKSHEAERAVNTASAAQVRQEINTRGIGHWRKYEKHLGVLAEALADSPGTLD